MPTMRDNATRVKRFRELKATLRTDRSRLLVGLDIAQAEHVVHVRHAHTRIVTPALTIPNTTRGFAQLWARLQQAQRATGCKVEAPPSTPSTFVEEGTGSATMETGTARHEADGCVSARDLGRQRARQVLPRADGAPPTKG